MKLLLDGWRRVLSFLVVIFFVGCVTAMAQSATQQVSLGWDASPDPSVTGYYLEYGTVSGVYTFQIDAGTNCTVEISDLIPNVPYYFVVISYEADQTQSVPSNEISYTAPQAGQLILAPIADELLNVGQNLTLTNSAVDTSPNATNLTYTLISAPNGMELNETNGVLFWSPSMADAGTTNLVVVQVNDDGFPSLTNTQSFTAVVGNMVNTVIGSSIVSIGQSGSVVISLNLSTPLTNLIFELSAPSGWISSLSIQPLLPMDGVISQNPPQAAQSQITAQPAAGKTFQGQIQFLVNFTSATNQITSFGSLQISGVTAFAADGSMVPIAPPASSQLVFVGLDSLLSLQVNANLGSLTLYGPVGASYEIQSSTDLNSGAWINEFSTTMTNLFQTFTNLPIAVSGMKFYRSQSL